MIVEWTGNAPLFSGTYLMSHPTVGLVVAKVFCGSWREAQNPEWLYYSVPGMNPQPVTGESTGIYWAGPIVDVERNKYEPDPFAGC